MTESDAYPWRPERVRVGTVGRPHGLDGAFYVEGPCGWWRFAEGTALLVNGSEHVVRRRAGTDARPLVGLVGVDDRDGAEKLRSAPLELARAALPAPGADDFYRFDLIGCRVEQGGRAVATIAAVEDGVAHDLLVLDDAAATRVPFVAALVPAVDVVGRRVELAPDLMLDA